MANVEITTLAGADLASFQSVMLNIVGEYLVSSGSQTTAVTSFSIPIPASGAAFRLEMRGVRMSVAGAMGGVFSFDGGSTYYYTGNPDCYSAAVMFIPFETVQAFDMTMQVMPGGTGGTPPDIARIGFITTMCFYPQGFSSKVDQDGVNPAATPTPPTTRLTNIMFFPYGNNVYPPTSGQTITCDSWRMFRLSP